MADNITTIQIRENVKSRLDDLRVNKESYEEIILKLMKLIDIQKRRQKDLLIEGCREMAQEDIRIAKEWEATDAKLNWEW